MASVVYLTITAPARLTDELTAAGHRVWEALAVSEVLALCEEHDIDAVIISPEIQDRKGKAANPGRISVLLESGATAANVIWELELLFRYSPYKRE
jgi:hypothetical protein